MRTPKEKAISLVDKFMDHIVKYEDALECAKITVEEILKAPSGCDFGEYEDDMDFTNYFEYWREVKNELNKL